MAVEQRSLRHLLLFAIGFLIFVVNFIIVFYASIGFNKWDYVPTVANGIVAASSILIAVTVFSLNYFQGTIVKKSTKKEYFSFVMNRLLELFALLVMLVFFGYLAVGLNQLPFALCFFLSVFLVQCGFIFDVWIVSQKYCFS
jgi:hypothetical protein